MYFDEVERRLKGEKEIKNWLSKHIGCVRRIAGNLHLADEFVDGTVISKSIMENAIEIGKYFWSHAKYCFTTICAENEFEKAIDVLNVIYKFYCNKQNDTLATRREIFRLGGNRGIKKIEELCPTLDLLEEYGYIKQVHCNLTNNSSKPSDIILLNPNFRPEFLSAII